MANDARRLSILIRGTGPARRWHRRLAAALQRDGHAVALEFEHARAAHSAGVDLLLELERFAYRARSAAFERQDAPQEQTYTGSDIVIELRERPSSQGDAIVLAPLFDGMPVSRRFLPHCSAGKRRRSRLRAGARSRRPSRAGCRLWKIATSLHTD